MLSRNYFEIDSLNLEFLRTLGENHKELSVKCNHCYTSALQKCPNLETLKLNSVVINRPLLGIICNLPSDFIDLDVLQFFSTNVFYNIPDFMIDLRSLAKEILRGFTINSNVKLQINCALRLMTSCYELRAELDVPVENSKRDRYCSEVIELLEDLIRKLREKIFMNLEELGYGCDNVSEIKDLVNECYRQLFITEGELNRFVFYPMLQDIPPNFLGIRSQDSKRGVVLTAFNQYQGIPSVFNVVDFGFINVINDGATLNHTIRVKNLVVPDSVVFLSINRMLYEFENLQIPANLKCLNFNDRIVRNASKTHFHEDIPHPLRVVSMRANENGVYLTSIESLECSCFIFPNNYCDFTSNQLQFDYQKVPKIVINYKDAGDKIKFSSEFLKGYQGAVYDLSGESSIVCFKDYYEIKTNCLVMKAEDSRRVSVPNNVTIRIPYKVTSSVGALILQYFNNGDGQVLKPLPLIQQLNDVLNLNSPTVCKLYYESFFLATEQVSFYKVSERNLKMVHKCFLRFFACCAIMERPPSVQQLKFAKKQGFLTEEVLSMLKKIPRVNGRYLDVLNKL